MELSSASTSYQLQAAALWWKGQITSMRELVQIESPSEHACGQPSIERWQVLEPVSMRWSWIRVFDCCNQVAIDPGEEEDKQAPRVKRAA